jgi:hypothetical protein
MAGKFARQMLRPSMTPSDSTSPFGAFFRMSSIWRGERTRST